MAISKIQYDDKVAINIDSTIPDINKCNASDLNEIKSVVNNNADEIPTISDEYGTSTADGYSQNYINENTINPSGEPSTSEEDVSSATFTNTLEAPMNIDLKGNTLQNGTPTPSSPIPINNVSGDNQIVVCGKNLLRYPYTNTSKEQNGLVFTDNNNGTITITGKATADTIFDFYQNANAMLVSDTTKTYTLSSSIDATNWTFQYYERYNNTWNYKTGGKILSFTPSSEATGQIFRLLINNNTQINGTFTFQIEQGNQATTYEAYNGTTYNIDLPVENLFDKDNANIENGYIDTGGMVLITSQLNRLFYIPCKPNTTYTISRSITTGTFRVATYDSTPFPSATSTSSTYSISGLIKDNSATSITITTGANAKYLIVHYGRLETNPNIEESLATIQIEQGSKANTYTPYGTTPIELNKIGTYQDYIYKENDKWYLHKEIGKVVLDGTEEWILLQTQTNTLRFSDNNILTNGLATDNIKILDDMFEVSTTTYDNGDYEHIRSAGAEYPNAIVILINKNRLSTYDRAGLNSWLNTHNVNIYYILATPTNTEITYTPLIEQLESIKNAMSKEGTTNVNQVNNDLPFILDLSVFNDTYNGRYESLVEQIPNNDNLVNVGTYVNDNYKVNMLYSHNLCNGRSQGYYVNQGATGCGYSGTDSGLIIKVDGGNYTISTSTSQARYRIGVLDTIPTTNIAITLYNGLNKDGTSDTITIDTTGHSYLVVNATDLTKIFIAKGDTPTTEPYITPSINVDGEEIYNAGKGIITAGFSSDYVLATTNTYVDVPLNTTYSQLGTNFEINNGEIICKKDGYIKVSCHFNYLYIAGTGNKWITINLYHTSYNSLIYMNLTGTKDERADVNGTDRLVYVYAGDKLKIQNYGTQNDTLRALYSYITCEYV